MAQIRIRVELNKGRTGAPLDKLGDVARQFERFLRALAADLQLEVKKGEWLAVNFKNGSVSWDAAFQGDVTEAAFRNFNHAVEFITDFDPDSDGTNGIVSDATLLEYGRIGQFLDPDEVVGVGIYGATGVAPEKWKRIDYRNAARIRQTIEAPVPSYGSIQGIVHALFKEAADPFFQLREFSSDTLVKCFYSDGQYREIATLLKDRRAVVHVLGHMKLGRATRTIEEIRVERIDVAKALTEDEFDRFFGSAPTLTGDLSTTKFLETVRDHGD